MPAGELRVIRRRIRSVQSTMKITRAMELIAASRIIKAEQRVAASRPYAERMAAVIGHLAGAAGGSVAHPLLGHDRRPGEAAAGRSPDGDRSSRDPSASAVVVISSDRGLCGAYNAGVLKLAEETLADMPGETRSVVAVGRKAQSYFRFRRVPVMEGFAGMSDQPRYEDAKVVAGWAMDAYLEGRLDRITLVYTSFLSSFRQQPKAVPLLPIDPSVLATVDPKIGKAAGGAEAPVEEAPAEGPAPDTIFEPEPGEILSALLPRGVESRVYSAMLDSTASEHAARRRAMKSATDNAGDLIKTLTRYANRARQAAITTEILEVVGGAEALSEAEGD